MSEWSRGIIVEKVSQLPAYPNLNSENWEPYESYMKAVVIEEHFDFSVLLVDFPSEIAEGNQLHTHPISDRRITVLKGSGVFIYSDGRNVHVHPLVPGDRVWMPRGTLHTFKSGGNGLLVESVHSPFIPFDDRLCLLYPKKESNKL